MAEKKKDGTIKRIQMKDIQLLKTAIATGDATEKEKEKLEMYKKLYPSMF
tara:strand:- start:176 stop:325 length:150 start_codon:yes stop_codon:yes gene_type:complete